MWKVKRRKALEDKLSNLVYEDFLEALNSRPEMARSYESLMSNLHLLHSTRPLTTILVTSTQPDEGKTTITANLALSMVLGGKRVLILDTDLRKPRIYQVFKLENTQGVADILTGSLNAQDVIQVVEVANDPPKNQSTLNVITSGRVSPNSFNVMESPKLREAIEYLRAVYDVILFDSSPLLSVSDALLLAPMVDGVILVLNTGIVSEKDAKRAKDRIEQAGGHILGVVMNRFNEKLHGKSYHPYYGYYKGYYDGQTT